MSTLTKEEFANLTDEELAEFEAERHTGAGILNRVEHWLTRFVAYPSEHASVAHALWIAHCHLMDCWHTTPRLAFMSAEKASGKTRALECSELLVPGPAFSINMSPAALVRLVDEGGVTVLFDEIDAIFGNANREEGNVEVRSILNGGYRRGAKVHRCAKRGSAIELEVLNSFAPVAVAGLRRLPDTLASRAIIIHMRRRAPDETVESFRHRKVEPVARALQQDLAEWCASIADSLVDAEPDLPAGLVDRPAECWEPLIVVADAAGGDWPKRTREAAMALVAGAIDDSTTVGVELLADIRDAFGADDKVATAELLKRLCEIPESRWKDIRGKPLDDRGLAARLKAYGIKSRDVKIDGRALKGYRREDFVDDWKRYLPEVPDISATAATSATDLITKNKKVALVAEVADKSGESDHTVGIEERAAVLEFDAGLSRSEAEATALDEVKNISSALPPKPDI